MKEKLPGYMGGSEINKGGLHKSLGIPSGQKIPAKKLAKAESSPSPKIKKQAVLAENFKNMDHKTSMKPNKPAPMLGSIKTKI